MAFSTEGMSHDRMQIKLENILPSLAKNLYGDDWRISIRELLQNGHDALVEGEANGHVKKGVAQIDIIPDPTHGTLTFVDNGMGMTKDDVAEYMATVGAGRKREQLESLSADNKTSRDLLDRIIGQYGIGFLSSFIIADQVEVLTRSQDKPAAPGVRALFTGATEWYHAEDASAQYGTRISLKLKKTPIADPETGKQVTIQELLNFERLKEEARRFGDLLPYPIIVHRSPEDRDGELTNTIEAPWERKTLDEGALLNFIKARHMGENEPMFPTAFRFSENVHGVNAHGVLYFPRPAQRLRRTPDSVSQVELFCRRMFISNDILPLLPEWASFVGVVVECPSLTPTLNRNDVIRHDVSFVALKQLLANAITEKVKELAEKHPQSFAELQNEHGERLYHALLKDFQDTEQGKELFFRAIINHLPFAVIDRTRPQGASMTLPQYREEARKKGYRSGKLDRIFYLKETFSVGQYRAMIIHKDIPVVLAVHPAAPPLLAAYQTAFPDEVAVEDVSGILDLYVDVVDQTAYEPLKQYIAGLDREETDEIKASRFSPSYVPAIMMVTSAADERQAELLEKFMREAGGVLAQRIRQTLTQEVQDARLGRPRLTVLLNDNNTLIRLLRDHCARGNPLTGAYANVLHEIYHGARSYAEPSYADGEHFYEFRNRLLESFLETERNYTEIQAEQSAFKVQLDTVRRENAALEKELMARQPGAGGQMEQRACALLLTDIVGSSRMVGFLNRQDSANILQQYANEVRTIVERHGGNVEKFTGDGLFGYFDAEGRTKEAAMNAYACAGEIASFTLPFFNSDAHARVLLDANIYVKGSRTVLHYGSVMSGPVAGSLALVGPAVVALFRAGAKKELYEQFNTIVSKPFLLCLQLPNMPNPIATDVKLDESLPPFTFYPHPAITVQ